MSALVLTNIRKAFNGNVAVEDFTLAVEHGEFVSLLGPSGCGKTTTLRMMAGFEQPTSGTITLDGVDITRRPANQRNVGMVFQSYALFPNMTVARNVGFGMKLKGSSAEEIERRAGALLELIHLPDKGGSYPHELSGGQQQRVALARALAMEPKVLLLDEPLSALDAKIRDELRTEIRRIQLQLGITTIYVTHDQEEAMSLSDRVVVMSRGAMEQVGTPFEIYNYPTTSFVASFVGKLNQLPGSVIDAAAGLVAVGGRTIRVEGVEAGDGAKVQLMLRPEEMRLGEVSENRLGGTVEAVSFLGSIVRVLVDLGTGHITMDLFNERRLRLPKVGEEVTVSFPPHAAWVMPES